MVCYCLDLRGDSKLSKVLANKLVSILTAIVQLILWCGTLLNYIIQPDYMKKYLQNTPSGYIAFSIIITIIIIIFSSLLLFGLLKNHATFIKSYLIFNMVLTMLFVCSLLVSLFTKPTEVGIGGFFGAILIIFLNILFFFIIRNYYLALTSKPNSANPA